MKNSILILLCSALFCITSCGNDDSPYEGEWNGNYTGADDNGVFNASISDNGDVNGSAISDSLPSTPFKFTGDVDDNGNFTATADIFFYEALFVGQLNGNSGSGTWTADSNRLSGVWQANKSN